MYVLPNIACVDPNYSEREISPFQHISKNSPDFCLIQFAAIGLPVDHKVPVDIFMAVLKLPLDQQTSKLDPSWSQII